MVQSAPSTVIYAGLPKNLTGLVDRNLGRHFRTTVGLAAAVANHCGIEPRKIKTILQSFHGLEGRQEFITAISGVSFINDTTATIPEATIAALQRFKIKAGTARKLILIAGGEDKKLDFRNLASEIKNNAGVLILLPGTATNKLKKEFRTAPRNLKTRRVKSMHEAVRNAYRLAQTGDYVLLSPGAASFGIFANEFDRGKQFIDEINKLK